jgi:hypothetical protein
MNAFTLTFNWKSFKVDLSDLYKWFQSNAGTLFDGFVTDKNSITIVFKSKPSQSIQEKVQQKWDSLSEGEEKSKTDHYNKREKAIKMATEKLPYISLGEMLPAEKKLFMRMGLTEEDKEDLLKKYPQVT